MRYILFNLLGSLRHSTTALKLIKICKNSLLLASLSQKDLQNSLQYICCNAVVLDDLLHESGMFHESDLNGCTFEIRGKRLWNPSAIVIASGVPLPSLLNTRSAITDTLLLQQSWNRVLVIPPPGMKSSSPESENAKGCLECLNFIHCKCCCIDVSNDWLSSEDKYIILLVDIFNSPSFCICELQLPRIIIFLNRQSFIHLTSCFRKWGMQPLINGDLCWTMTSFLDLLKNTSLLVQIVWGCLSKGSGPAAGEKNLS